MTTKYYIEFDITSILVHDSTLASFMIKPINVLNTISVFGNNSQNNKPYCLFKEVEFDFEEKDYPKLHNLCDFYIEDFYPHSVYRDIQLPHVEEEPRYYQMKRFDKVPDSVKKKITKQLRKNKIEDSEFDLYENFLDELLKLFKIS